MKKNIESLLINILLPLAVGSLSAVFAGRMGSSYNQMIKPSFSPPAIVFPIVWTILFILMGLSAYLIANSNDVRKDEALKTYYIQLAFNFLWSIVFFRFGFYLFAFVWLIALIVLIVKMIRQFAKIDKRAAYLNIPYLLWCIFAAVLNFGVYWLNR